RTEAGTAAAAGIDGVVRDDKKTPGRAEHRVTDDAARWIADLIGVDGQHAGGAVSPSDHWPATWGVGRSRRREWSGACRGPPIAGPASLTKHPVRSMPPDRTSSSIRPHTARSTPIWNG